MKTITKEELEKVLENHFGDIKEKIKHKEGKKEIGQEHI